MAWLAALPQKRWFNALFLAGLLAAVAIVYAPSLDHVPRADQWAYLVDTRNCHGFAELLAESYSYNRVRVVGPGDVDLFRPVLFFVLAAEKHLFGNWFAPAQAIGIALHGVVVTLLFLLLRRVGGWPGRGSASAPEPPGAILWLPHAVAVFFALNFAIIELVVWAHLHGYVLFLIFVLAALLLVGDLLYRPELSIGRRRATIVGCWVIVALSAFTYELGQFFAVLVGAALAWGAWRGQRRAGAAATFIAFALVLPAYQLVNRWDKELHAGRYPEEDLQEQIVHKAVSPDTLEHAGRFSAFTLAQPFFPAATGWWYQGERIHIQEPVFGWAKYVRPQAKVLISYLVAGAFFLLLGLGLRGLWRGQRRELAPMLLVPAALLGLYAAITILGRMNMRPSNFVLCSNSYYTYTALLLLLIAAFVAWQGVAGRRGRGVSAGFAILVVGLTSLGGYSAGRVRHVCQRLRTQYAEFHAAVADVEAFIAQHRHEPGFSLAFDLRPDDPFPVTHSVPFAWILFPRWIDNHEPKYVATFPEGRAEFSAAADYRARHPELRQVFPDLVEVGACYNIWMLDGQYYGTLHWDDVFRPGLKDYAYLIEAGSLKEVRDQVSVRFEEFMEDLRIGYCVPPRLGTETIEEDYRGFTLTQAGCYCYATPAAEGPFHANRFNARRYSAFFVADDEETLRRYVDEHVAACGLADRVLSIR